MVNLYGLTKRIFSIWEKLELLKEPKDALESFKSFLENLGETKLIFSACPIHRNHSFVKWLQKNASYEDVTKNEKKGDVTFRHVVQESSPRNRASVSKQVLLNVSRQNWSTSTFSGQKRPQNYRLISDPMEEKLLRDMIMEMVPDFGEEIFSKLKHSFQENWTGLWNPLKNIFFKARMRVPFWQPSKIVIAYSFNYVS